MEKENEEIQQKLDSMKQAMDEEDEEVSLWHTARTYLQPRYGNGVFSNVYYTFQLQMHNTKR